MYASNCSDTSLSWLLVYTKRHAEAWAELNLRKQGFVSLLPRVASGSGYAPLFPRYLFVGHEKVTAPRSLASTYGIQYVVHCGEHPARVPAEVISELLGRMNENGVVQLDVVPKPRDELFAKRERDRVRALLKFAQAGFRVRSA